MNPDRHGAIQMHQLAHARVIQSLIRTAGRRPSRKGCHLFFCLPETTARALSSYLPIFIHGNSAVTQRVVVYKSLPEDLLAQLQARFVVTQVDEVDADGPFAQAMAEADGVIGSGLSLSAAVLDQATRLRTVATVSAGFDQFDVPDLTRRGILLSHTPAALTETVADTVLMLMLMTARRAIELVDQVRDGRWQGSIGPECYSSDVHGKSLGIVGMGRIGLAVGKRAHFGFGMNVLYHNRNQHPAAEQALQAKWLPLDELLQKKSDFVCVLLPLSAETEKRFSTREFALMQSHAFFY